MLDFKSIEALLQEVHYAHKLMMSYYKTSELDIQVKADDTPVTAADIVVHDYLTASLTKLTPGVRVVSEEDAPDPSEVKGDHWLVDPLDGTKGFIEGTGQFTINLALMHAGKPVFGLISHPVTGEIYLTAKGGAYCVKQDGSWQQLGEVSYNGPLRVVMGPTRKNDSDMILHQELGLLAASPRISHIDYCSSALKFTRLLQGTSDVYPGLRPTMEWDIAAGHALLQAIGGEIYKASGEVENYGKDNWLNGPIFALRDKAHYPMLQELVEEISVA